MNHSPPKPITSNSNTTATGGSSSARSGRGIVGNRTSKRNRLDSDSDSIQSMLQLMTTIANATSLLQNDSDSDDEERDTVAPLYHQNGTDEDNNDIENPKTITPSQRMDRNKAIGDDQQLATESNPLENSTDAAEGGTATHGKRDNTDEWDETTTGTNSTDHTATALSSSSSSSSSSAIHKSFSHSHRRSCWFKCTMTIALLLAFVLFVGIAILGMELYAMKNGNDSFFSSFLSWFKERFHERT